jgi:hypothetical protein
MIISFHAQGRLGNNIFQYIAVKVIQKYLRILGFTCDYEFNKRTNWFTEYSYSKLYELLVKATFDNHYIMYFKDLVTKDLFFDGFYQFDYHILKERDFIRSLFTPENEERINDQYRVCDIVNNITKHKRSFNPEDIVTHVRLDDFVNVGILHHKTVSKIIKESGLKGKVYVVCDKLKKDFDKKYIEEFKSHTNFTLVSNDDMFKDLAYLWFAPNLICNNSTFCWIAGILGDCERSWCPVNKGKHPPQSFEKVKEDTVVYDWDELPHLT